MGLYSHLDTRDIVAGFYPALQAPNEAAWALRIGRLLTSDSETENYRWLGQVPVMREWVGARQEVPLNKYSMSITNAKYEATMAIDLDDLRRDKTAQLRQRVADLASRTQTHWNSLVSTLIGNGTAGGSGLAYDGQFFFDTDHDESGSDQTNDLTTTEIPSSNVSDTDAPTATEAANIITEVCAHMATLTDDQGEPINQDAKRFLIMTTGGRGAIAAAFINAIFQQNLGSNTVTNPVQGLMQRGFSFEVVQNTRLTAADAVYFFSVNETWPAFLLQEEVPVQAQLDTTQEFSNDRHLFGVKAVRAAGFGMWQLAAYLPLT